MPIVLHANFPHACCPPCQLSSCQLSSHPKGYVSGDTSLSMSGDMSVSMSGDMSVSLPGYRPTYIHRILIIPAKFESVKWSVLLIVCQLLSLKENKYIFKIY